MPEELGIFIQGEQLDIDTINNMYQVIKDYPSLSCIILTDCSFTELEKNYFRDCLKQIDRNLHIKLIREGETISFTLGSFSAEQVNHIFNSPLFVNATIGGTTTLAPNSLLAEPSSPRSVAEIEETSPTAPFKR